MNNQLRRGVSWCLCVSDSSLATNALRRRIRALCTSTTGANITMPSITPPKRARLNTRPLDPSGAVQRIRSTFSGAGLFWANLAPTNTKHTHHMNNNNQVMRLSKPLIMPSPPTALLENRYPLQYRFQYLVNGHIGAVKNYCIRCGF